MAMRHKNGELTTGSQIMDLAKECVKRVEDLQVKGESRDAYFRVEHGVSKSQGNRLLRVGRSEAFSLVPAKALPDSLKVLDDLGKMTPEEVYKVYTAGMLNNDTREREINAVLGTNLKKWSEYAMKQEKKGKKGKDIGLPDHVIEMIDDYAERVRKSMIRVALEAQRGPEIDDIWGEEG